LKSESRRHVSQALSKLTLNTGKHVGEFDSFIANQFPALYPFLQAIFLKYFHSQK